MPGKVLIVDEIATNRIMLHVKLSAAGFSVLTATNAAEGLAMARKTLPDLVVCPVRLKDMSSLKFVMALQKEPALAALPCIVLSNTDNSALRLKLLSAGATDVLNKPMGVTALLARFRAVLRNVESQEQARLKRSMAQVLDCNSSLANPVHTTSVAVLSQSGETAQIWASALKTVIKTAHRFALSANGFNSLSKLLQNAEAPDIVVVDLTGGHAVKGLSLLSDLRAASQTRHTKLIAVFDLPKPKIFCDALDRGAHDVLPSGFCPHELALRISRQASAKHRDDLRRQHMHDGLHAAATDALTGLYNRRFAIPHLARIAENSSQTDQPCAVVIIDVDHFKTINDNFGHDAGDAALIALSNILQSSLRPSDLAARIGGEEFLIVLPETGTQQAQEVARRLCRLVATHPFKLPGVLGPVHLTVSIGVAVTKTDAINTEIAHSSAEALLRAADKALYGSKKHGRNQVTISERSAA